MSRKLRTEQAARRAGVTTDTLRSWVRRGKLRAQRTAGGHIRIDQGELERIINPAPDSK